MPSAPHWIPVVLFAVSLALWRRARERARLRGAWMFLGLWAAIRLVMLLAPDWLPGATVIEPVSLALVELAAVLIAVVVVADVILRQLALKKFIVEIAIVAGHIIVLIHLLFELGVNVTGIFATSAVATAVLGLALQDMLGNVAGGIALELEGSLSPGDYIVCGEVAGWVQHVRLRHTAVRTTNNGLVLVPNHQLTRSAVNICQPGYRQFVPFSMPYRVNQQIVINEVERALRNSPIEGIASDPAPRCVIRELTPGHVQFAAVVWLSSPGYDTLPISDVTVRICFALKRAGLPVSEIVRALSMTPGDSMMNADPGAVGILRRTPILRLLKDADLLELAGFLRELSFAPGEQIVRQGDEGDSMYFIVSGEVEIRFRSPDGAERQVAVMAGGDFFGEASLLTGEPRSATAVARAMVDCYRLDKAGLQHIVESRADLAEDMSVVMAHRLTELAALRETLDRETAMAREIESQQQLLARIRRFFGMTPESVT